MSTVPGHDWDKKTGACTCGWRANDLSILHWESQWGGHVAEERAVYESPVSLALGLRERFDVTEVDGKFGLYLDGHLLGTSKTHFDCDAAREVIVAALGEEYHY